MIARHVVIGVDYSNVVIRTAKWVVRYIAAGADVALVHATEPAPLPVYARSLLAGRGDPIEEQLDRDRQRLENWRDENEVAPARIFVREGRADEVLNEVARESGADLIAIGAHGDVPTHFHLGTTADRVLREAKGSVLVGRGEMSEPPRRVLVAVDDARITSRMLGIAGRLADRFDARLHAVHVLSNAAYSHILSINAATTDSEREKLAQLDEDLGVEANRWLHALWRAAGREDRVSVEIRHGSPGQQVLAAAAGIRADLIIIGRYGTGRVIPALLGSVVGTVMHEAACPVLVVADAPDAGGQE